MAEPINEGEQKSTKEEEIFERAWALITNFYPQALLIVHFEKEKCLRWRSTDTTWAMGAAERYRDSLKGEDMLDRTDRRGNA